MCFYSSITLILDICLYVFPYTPILYSMPILYQPSVFVSAQGMVVTRYLSG